MIQQLLAGKRVDLGFLDLDRDAATIAAWTEDPEYWNLYEREIGRPLSRSQVKKKFSADPRFAHQHFRFAIYQRPEHRLIGLASLEWVDWSNSNAALALAIGRPEDRGTGYEADALQALLQYAFHELNLYRLQASAFEYAVSWRQQLELAGFRLEVCRRREILRAGRRWDALIYGILRAEWQPATAGAEGAA